MLWTRTYVLLYGPDPHTPRRQTAAGGPIFPQGGENLWTAAPVDGCPARSPSDGSVPRLSQRHAPRLSGGKENRSPAQRVRFGKEEPRRARTLIFKKSRSKANFAPTWWRRVDSNHRSETQQIYSLPPLATRELLHMKLWSWWTDSNPRPADYKSAALPAELHQQLKSAVQQQVLFYQKVYTLSTTFFKFFFFLFLPLIRPLRPSPLRRGGRLFQSKGGGAPREC